MIKVSGVSKRFGSHYAVKNASFTIDKDERVAILGRSGAGKTTLLNILAGYWFAIDGNVTVNGYDLLKSPIEVKQSIGYMSQNPALYLHMTVREYLDFMCAIRRVPKYLRSESVAGAAERLNLQDKQGCLIKSLSIGDRRKTALAGALCANPDIILLDEPTAGLDPDEITEIRAVIRDIRKTIIVASANIQEVTALCGKVIIMHEGQILAQDTMEKFKNTAGGRKRISVQLAAGRATGLSLLKNIDGVDAVECIGSKEPGSFDYVVDAYDKDVRADIFKSAAKAGLVLLALKPLSVTLEDVFYQLTCQSGGKAV